MPANKLLSIYIKAKGYQQIGVVDISAGIFRCYVNQTAVPTQVKRNYQKGNTNAHLRCKVKASYIFNFSAVDLRS